MSQIARIARRQQVAAESLDLEKDKLSKQSQLQTERQVQTNRRASELERQAQAEKNLARLSQQRIERRNLVRCGAGEFHSGEHRRPHRPASEEIRVTTSENPNVEVYPERS